MKKFCKYMLIISLLAIMLAACNRRDDDGSKDAGSLATDSQNAAVSEQNIDNAENDDTQEASAGSELAVTQAPASEDINETETASGTTSELRDNETAEAKEEAQVDRSVKEFEYVPPAYTLTDTHKGTIETVEYKTRSYDSKDLELTKSLNVYLPHGYNPEDRETRYNVFYLMHGGGENQNTIFGGPGKNTELMRIVDNMIKNGDIEPLIIVTPTFYNPGNSNASELTRNFHNELINDILPAVEGKYNTYAASTSPEDLKASRSHRAFGGFSMGGACTWYVYINCLDYFEYFMPLSGDCWALGDTAGRYKPAQTAELLAKVPEATGYAPDEYYIFCATGAKDIAYDNMVPQTEAMKKLTDRFIYTADFTQGNFYFMVCKFGTHSWNYVNQYIYNILPYFFFK